MGEELRKKTREEIIDEAIKIVEKDLPIILSLKEVSQRTGISYECLRQLCLKNKIVHFRSGAKYLVNYTKFIEFLNGKNNIPHQNIK